MNIIQIVDHKKQHMDLLLLADEQESMIDRYLERGAMFVLDDNGVKAVCVVTDEGTFVNLKILLLHLNPTGRDTARD